MEMKARSQNYRRQLSLWVLFNEPSVQDLLHAWLGSLHCGQLKVISRSYALHVTQPTVSKTDLMSAITTREITLPITTRQTDSRLTASLPEQPG